MSFERDTPHAAHPPGFTRRTRLLIAVLTVFVGIPLVLLAWIGGVFLVEAWGWRMSSTQVLAWILAAISGGVVWPLSLRGLRRQLSRRFDRRPAPAPSPGEATVRVVLVVLGAVGIIALSGPLDIVSAAASAGATVSIGPRENGLLLQLVASLVILILAAPALVVTQRVLRRLPADDPRRAGMEERQNWHVAAAAAWVVSLLVGYVLSVATLVTL